MSNVWVWERDGKWEGGKGGGVVTVSQNSGRYKRTFCCLVYTAHSINLVVSLTAIKYINIILRTFHRLAN